MSCERTTGGTDLRECMMGMGFLFGHKYKENARM